MLKSILSLGLLLATIMVFSQHPELHWAVQMNGTLEEDGNSMAFDSNGNLYIAKKPLRPGELKVGNGRKTQAVAGAYPNGENLKKECGNFI
jgi:hypothetical protein